MQLDEVIIMETRKTESKEFITRHYIYVVATTTFILTSKEFFVLTVFKIATIKISFINDILCKSIAAIKMRY